MIEEERSLKGMTSAVDMDRYEDLTVKFEREGTVCFLTREDGSHGFSYFPNFKVIND